MRIALMADFHANLRALEACLDHAKAQKADRLVFLGDYVGYGPEPQEVMERIMQESERGAIAVAGNHDQAVAEARESMNADAETAMAWTRGQLGPEAREFLSSLPLRFEDDTRLYVHASPPDLSRLDLCERWPRCQACLRGQSCPDRVLRPRSSARPPWHHGHRAAGLLPACPWCAHPPLPPATLAHGTGFRGPTPGWHHCCRLRHV